MTIAIWMFATSLNRQGNDRGTQYRTGIYYTEKADLPVIKQAIKTLVKKYAKPIVVEVEPLRNFYQAEEYHQNYLGKHPNGYCHINPDLFVDGERKDRTNEKTRRTRNNPYYSNENVNLKRTGRSIVGPNLVRFNR